MTTFSLASALVAGKNAGSVDGFDPQFSQGLSAMFGAAPADIQQNLKIASGYRSPAEQAVLWQQALQKYGSADIARKWVAPPGKSEHNSGHAADLKFLTPQALAWAHANAVNYGLNFPLSNENWHIEQAGARGAPSPMPNNSPGAVASRLPGPVGASTIVDSVAPDDDAIALSSGETSSPLAAMFSNISPDIMEAQATRKKADQQRRQALFGPGGVADVFS